MIRPALNLLIILFFVLGLQACDVYNAAFRDIKQTETSSSGSDNTNTTTITVTPTGLGFSEAGSQVFSASGGTGSFTWTLSGQINNFAGVSIDSFTSSSATIVFSIPTALEDTQTIKIMATDGSGVTGSTTFALQPVTT